MISGLLGLSRNLGLFLGALVLGAVFAFGVGTNQSSQAKPNAISLRTLLTFTLAIALLIVATFAMGRRGVPVDPGAAG